MPSPSLTHEQMVLCAQCYVAEGGNQKRAAKRAGLNYSTFKSRVGMVRDLAPELLGLPPGEVKETPPKTVDDDVKEHRTAAESRVLKARIRDAARVIASMEDRIKDLEWAANASYDAAEWATPAREAKKSEHMPYLLTSDFHCGEVVRAEETEAGYGYDSGVFVRRYRHMIDTTIYLSFEHAGRDWTFPGMIYARGGDIISGNLHPELIETDDMTPLEAVRLVAEEEMGGIRKLADAFGRVEVKSFGSAGNHDRNLFKPTTKNAAGHSYDTLVEYMLRREFASDKRVTFQTSRSFDVRFPIYQQRILLTHGDRIGSRGGQGFIGPAATILRGVAKVMQEQAALGFHVDQVHLGHFHYPLLLPHVLANGSFPGYSEFAKQFRMRPNPPQQWLAFHHPRRGVVDVKPIMLADA